ncbi:MAG TPA: type I-MYXAN CRISPR-associated protein Cas5/Cmx5/DevS [Gemmataceae bacterium]
MLALSIMAPFAVCRSFTAGWYRPTATFLTPSAAYGLLLNLAGIETRLREEDEAHPGGAPATLTRPGLPSVKIAIGKPADAEYPRVATMFQQLHNYPVGAGGSERAATTFGNKYNISPVRRELLVDLQAVIVLDDNGELESAVRLGLSGQATPGRYGLPFVGDNSFLPDRIEPMDVVPPACWFERVTATAEELRPRTTRLTVWIDRADMSKTRSDLYAPVEKPMSEIPPDAWTEIKPP